MLVADLLPLGAGGWVWWAGVPTALWLLTLLMWWRALGRCREVRLSLAQSQDALGQIRSRLRESEAKHFAVSQDLSALQAELRRLRSGSFAPAARAAIPVIAMEPRSALSDGVPREAIAALGADIDSLQGFAEMTERWHDQMKIVIRNNADLKEQLESFEKIVKSFDVVAINAAVTAAKAGVHGRGFGVVAEFVRELSSKTAREAAQYMRMVDYNSLITTTTFQEIQASGNLIKTAMFSLKAGLDRMRSH